MATLKSVSHKMVGGHALRLQVVEHDLECGKYHLKAGIYKIGGVKPISSGVYSFNTLDEAEAKLESANALKAKMGKEFNIAIPDQAKASKKVYQVQLREAMGLPIYNNTKPAPKKATKKAAKANNKKVVTPADGRKLAF